MACFLSSAATIVFASLKLSYLPNFSSLVEPQNFKQDVKDAGWIEAMKQEIKALEDNRTREVVYLPHGKHTVGSKWVYKIKYKANVETERFKDRLISKGYSQQERLYYHDIFSPAVKMVTVRSVIALAVSKDGTYIKWMFIMPFYKKISVKKCIWICLKVSEDRGSRRSASHSSPCMDSSKP
uniref:Uncharacterized mitochondrial protein AtMg00820-like n=1 Tax=Nicotiana tabacum TaxID=4097 RepID=A0A1S4A0Y4_TOBAC|nr:PREDICTED: uncharacterized mitochondrial protein AtMg00820-like [Nicotiana tabacum]